MLFNSFAFAVFLPIVFILYWSLPHKFRWILLLAASYYFYMSWNIKYVFLILFTTFISYLAGRFLEKESRPKRKRLILAGAAIICLGVLFFFKYFNFANESITAILNLFTLHLNPVTLQLVLPVGISFYTFQTLSYVIDVYKDDIPAEHHFGKYAVFISFFPQLVAGPIERTSNLLPQLKNKQDFNYEQAAYGLKLMAWGYFKKLMIADALSQYVSRVYNNPQLFQGFSLILATVFFSIQIYCDFSGYSDIAIGTAKLLGIDLMTNFKSPYLSQSIKEFWGRWHISLSTWFRDYVYIPLGGNRVGKIRHSLNLMITFLTSGLWHGANWTFVAWGGLHGFAQVFEHLIIPPQSQKSKGILRFIRIIVIFAFCSFAWIFFVSNSIGDALYVICHLFDNITSPIAYLHNGFTAINMGKSSLFIMLLYMLILFIYDLISMRYDVINAISEQKIIIRWGIYICFLLIIIFFSQKGIGAEFVYFQF